MTKAPIAFVDLRAQQIRIRDKIDARIASVLDHGAFIMGPEVQEFETRLTGFCGAKHSISCANGTDAILLALLAEGVASGDAVFVPAFTFVATAEVVRLVGATPVFVDVLPDTFNMDPTSFEAAIDVAKGADLKPRAVIPVDLFGLPADYNAITPIAKAYDMVVIADSAQGFGGMYKGIKVGTLADYTTTSFFPAKPLGCYGDGGAIFTENDEKAALLKSLRFHGKGTDKYDNVRIGTNSRLDTIQAAVLLEKLAIFIDEIEARNNVAARYTQALGNIVDAPKVPDGYSSVWAQYTLKVDNREDFQARMKAAGVPTAVYYPIPMNRQTGYKNCPIAPHGLPVSDDISQRVISLPMHPYLDQSTQRRIIDAVVNALS